MPTALQLQTPSYHQWFMCTHTACHTNMATATTNWRLSTTPIKTSCYLQSQQNQLKLYLSSLLLLLQLQIQLQLQTLLSLQILPLLQILTQLENLYGVRNNLLTSGREMYLLQLLLWLMLLLFKQDQLLSCQSAQEESDSSKCPSLTDSILAFICSRAPLIH